MKKAKFEAFAVVSTLTGALHAIHFGKFAKENAQTEADDLMEAGIPCEVKAAKITV